MSVTKEILPRSLADCGVPGYSWGHQAGQGNKGGGDLNEPQLSNYKLGCLWGVLCKADWSLVGCRRYYICDNKLGALGWKEEMTWEKGLQTTVDWYLQNGFKDYWDNGDVEAALQPHPIIHPSNMLSGPATNPGS